MLAQFEAKSFEDLYQGVKHIALEDFIPKDGAFPVKGYSLDSQLHSVPDCQAIVKKAAVDRLGANYGLSWLPETGATYQIRFSIMKDRLRNFPRYLRREPSQAGLPRKRESGAPS